MRVKYFLGFGLLVCTVNAHSAGFQVQAITPSHFGVANAGANADVSDAGIVYHNPAGMYALGYKAWSVGLNYIHPNSRLSDVRLDVTGLPAGTQIDVGSTPKNLLPDATTPSLFYTQPLNKSMAVGLAITVPFGSDLDYLVNTSAGVVESVTEFKVVDFQPALSYAFSESLQVGASIHAMYAQQEVIRNTPLPRSSFALKGSDTAVGFGVGGLYTFNSDKTRIGVNYRSKVGFRFKGQPTAQSLSVNLPTLGVTNWITTPSQVQLGVAHKTNGKLSFHVGITHVNWRDFSSFDVGFLSPVSAVPALQLLPTATEPFNFRNTTSYALGVRYQMTPAWQLRMGYVWDESVGNGDTSPYASSLVLLQRQDWFTLGVGYHPAISKPKGAQVEEASADETHAQASHHWSWDGVIAWMPSSSKPIFAQSVNSGNTSQTAAIRAQTSARAVMVGLQVNYAFR